MGRTGIGRQVLEQTRTQLTSPTCIVISSVAFTNSLRRRRPEPVLTYESAAASRINDMVWTGIGQEAFEQTQTQHASPTCIVISMVVFTNLLVLAHLVPSLPFEAICFVRMVIGSLTLPNSLPVCLPILRLPLLSALFLNTPCSRCK